jgi:cation diffusion facilitator CzcD-associated flavoprotein CzcO
MHDHLESNIDARVMSYTAEPFPSPANPSFPSKNSASYPFRHRSQIQDWISGLVNRNGYEKFVEYNTTVELAEKVGKEWVLTLRKSAPGEEQDFWWQEKFDALVVANGHYSIPFIPNVTGLLEAEKLFPGTVEHSKSYRGPGSYSGKVSEQPCSASVVFRPLSSSLQHRRPTNLPQAQPTYTSN